MSDSLYERDPFAWSREQAAALRTPDSDSIDWGNVAEEIESLELYARARRVLIRDAALEGRRLDLPESTPYSWDDVLGRDGIWTPEPRYAEAQA